MRTVALISFSPWRKEQKMANYINTQTLAYPVTQGQIQQEYPNTSFPVPFVAPEPYEPVFQSPQPSFDSMTQYCREVAPVLDGNNWMQAWEVVDLDPEQIAYNEEQARQRNKQQAETLLQQTDWTTIPDVSDPTLSDPYLTNAAEFAAYRSNIRKIAVNPPVTVEVWPIEPEEVWAYTDA
jgi:hypothetical protein